MAERMKPMKTTASVLATSTLALTLLSGCAGLSGIEEPPRVNLVALSPVELNLLEQRYRAKLRIRNPNDAPLKVRGLDYTIHINEKKFADGVSDRRFTVPAYGESLVEVTLSSSLFRLLEQFSRLEPADKLVIRYRISGGLSVTGSPTKFPFSYEDELDFSRSTGAATGRVI
jgi:LEA14-like dessication related protein